MAKVQHKFLSFPQEKLDLYRYYFMKDLRCFICKYSGKTTADTYQNEIYEPQGRSLSIPLCYGHSIDLFKMGQVNFIIKHRPNFSQYFGFENDELILRYFEIK